MHRGYTVRLNIKLSEEANRK